MSGGYEYRFSGQKLQLGAEKLAAREHPAKADLQANMKEEANHVSDCAMSEGVDL